MKRLILIAFFPLFIVSTWDLSAQENFDVVLVPRECLTETEQHLARLINEYRSKKGLPAVELSASLSYVAKAHSRDLKQNHTHSGRCNLHSWSKKGAWSACCYTPDHKRAECMWNKPRELTSYTGDGYEIAYYNSRPLDDPLEYAEDILKSWQGSPAHHMVIINRGIWRNVKWKAMGIGICNEYVTVWFGKEADPSGIPDLCN